MINQKYKQGDKVKVREAEDMARAHMEWYAQTYPKEYADPKLGVTGVVTDWNWYYSTSPHAGRRGVVIGGDEYSKEWAIKFPEGDVQVIGQDYLMRDMGGISETRNGAQDES